MITKSKKLVIAGAGEFGEIAYEYFTYDSEYEVIGFTVESQYKDADTFLGLPLVSLDEIESKYSQEDIEVHVAITYTKLNRGREKVFNLLKSKGYKFANYISSHAFVWHNVELGDNVFIFENNVVQHKCKIGDGVVLWSGNHIGHQTQIGNFCYMSSHVVVSGYCTIGDYCFIGVNSAFADHLTLGANSFVAMSSNVTKSLEGGFVVKGSPAENSKLSALKYMKV
ncbi:MAG: acetyltransferase [Pseudomonadota bacterium]|nr:acetyltransferase [Pseudomonadota bacterium]